MRRRSALQAALALASAAFLTGHSPYKQWHAFRSQRLIVVASGADSEACRIADAVSERMLALHPESKAVSAQARSARDVVQMLRTHQLPVAVLDLPTAIAAYAGRGEFEREGALRLETLTAFDGYLLLCLEDVPEDKAYAIAEASARLPHSAQASAPISEASSAPAIPFHPGALAFQQANPAQPGR